LAALFVTTVQRPFGARHAVCTTLPHDEHEIAALALGIHLSQHGYRVSYLGSKLPLDALDGFVRKQKPSLLCVSCITLPDDSEFEDYVQQLSEYKSYGVRVVLGGQTLGGRTPPKGSEIEFHTDWRSFVA
jgi:methanogenic corrinoid protein MtbC1